MADKNLRVNLIANTSGFKSAMSESSNQIKLLNSEFKNAANETDKYGNKVDSTGAKQKQLSGIIEQYKNRITAIKNEQRHWTAELEKGNITEEQHAQKQQELARRLNNTEGEMKKYEGQLKRLNAEGKNTTKTYAEFDAQFRDVGRTMRNVGAVVGVAAGVGFTAMKRVLGGVVEEAMGFEHQMAEVKAISGATGEQFEEMSGQAKELGRQTIYTAEQVGEAQAGLARSGFETNEIIDAMPGLLDLAASSNMELGRASNITANILRGFNKDATESGRVADILAKGAATANTDVEGLGNSMEVVAPVASTLNVEFEDLAAATGIMADNGIEGSKAGRMLRQGMLRLAKPTGEAGDLIEELGINVFDSEGNMRSMDKVVGELEKGLKGQSKQAKAAALATIFGSESTAGWSALLDEGSGSLKNYITELQNSEGAAADMAETMQDTAQGAITRMQSALSGLKIELGEALLPYLVEAADKVSEFADKLENMDEATVETIAETALLITAVLGVTTAVAGLVTGIGALMAFAGPVGAAIVGGTALFGGLAVAIRTNIKRTEQLAEEQAQAKEEALRYGAGLREGTQEGVRGYIDLYEGAKLEMHKLKNMSGEEAEETKKKVVSAFKEMGNEVVSELESFSSDFEEVVNEIYGVYGDAGEERAKTLNQQVQQDVEEMITSYEKASARIAEIVDEYGGNVEKYPEKVRKSYEKNLEIMRDGVEVFAVNYEDALAVRNRIAENKDKILAQEAEGYLKEITDVHKEAGQSINENYVEQAEVIEKFKTLYPEQADVYDELMKTLETSTAEAYYEIDQIRAESVRNLYENADETGKLLDYQTGKELERKTITEKTTHAYGAAMKKREETDEEYYMRYIETNEAFLEALEKNGEETLNTMERNTYEWQKSMGASEEEAREFAENMRESVLEEFSKGDDEARESGRRKSKAHRDGLLDGLEGNEQASKSISDGSDAELSKGKDKARKHGVDKGQAHKQGIDSTKEGNRKSTYGIVDTVFFELAKGKTESENYGADKGKAHEYGLYNTLRGNKKAGSTVSKGASDELSKTTDGGGGFSAGNMFMRGILSQRESSRTAGVNVATSGKQGLNSVSTSSAGDNFVAGFRSSIYGGLGSVGTAAASLASRALSSLRSKLKEASPSRETRQSGEYFTQGFTLGIKGQEKGAVNQAIQLARNTYGALDDELSHFKNTFSAIGLAIEDNKQTLKVEHTLDDKLESILKYNQSHTRNNDELMKTMVEAMFEQNKHLQQQNQMMKSMMREDRNVYLDSEKITKKVNHNLAMDAMGKFF